MWDIFISGKAKVSQEDSSLFSLQGFVVIYYNDCQVWQTEEGQSVGMAEVPTGWVWEEMQMEKRKKLMRWCKANSSLNQI